MELAWVRAAMAAWALTSADASLDFSEATSASITADWAELRFSSEVAMVCERKSKRDMDAPTEARAEEMSAMAYGAAKK